MDLKRAKRMSLTVKLKMKSNKRRKSLLLNHNPNKSTNFSRVILTKTSPSTIITTTTNKRLPVNRK